MSIFLENEAKINLDIPYNELATTIVNHCLDYLECPYEVEVTILLTGNEEIHQVNLETRNMDKPTDVLSFPMIEWETIGAYEFLEDHFECFHPDSGELMLGDILISLEKVEEQAEEYGHLVEREYSFLMVHSILHLFGYDHMVDADKEKMEEAQQDIMNLLGILR